MRCPLCDVSMKEIDRRGVEVDICPECKGVWLDRGELDKIIDRANVAAAPQPAPGYGGDRGRPQGSHDKYDTQGYGHKRKKKSSLLSDLFDF